MSDFDKVLKDNNCKNAEELTALIDNLKKEKTVIDKVLKDNNCKNVEELAALIEDLKKEKKAAKTAETKAFNDAKKSEKEFNEAFSALNDELQTALKTIEELKSKAERQGKNLLDDDKLKEKAAKIMKQDKVNTVFISLKGHAFLNESDVKNHCGTKYKKASMFDGKVVLENPA